MGHTYMGAPWSQMFIPRVKRRIYLGSIQLEQKWRLGQGGALSEKDYVLGVRNVPLRSHVFSHCVCVRITSEITDCTLQKAIKLILITKDSRFLFGYSE